MPFIKSPKPHTCKTPNTVWRGGKQRQIGLRWYCPVCKTIWQLEDDQRDGAYWIDTNEKWKIAPGVT